MSVKIELLQQVLDFNGSDRRAFYLTDQRFKPKTARAGSDSPDRQSLKNRVTIRRRGKTIPKPGYGQKAVSSFADAVARLCRWLWRERIKSIFGHAAIHDKKSIFCWKFWLQLLKTLTKVRRFTIKNAIYLAPLINFQLYICKNQRINNESDHQKGLLLRFLNHSKESDEQMMEPFQSPKKEPTVYVQYILLKVLSRRLSFC